MQTHIWSNDDWLGNQSLLERKDKNEGYFVSRVLRNYDKHDTQLSTIEIETVNRCNGTCSFCPVSVGNDRRSYCKMSDKLFQKIIDELVDMEYRGFISLFCNNEPMLDTRLLDLIKYAKKRLPYAKHALCTNGSKLTRESYSELLAILDYLYIDNYNDELKILPHLSWISTEMFNEYDCHVNLYIRRKNQVLGSRGGNAPNKQNRFCFSSPCILPFMQMVVRPDGKVGLCCHDAYGDVTLGDLTEQSISEVWECSDYKALRQCLLTKGRGVLKLCENCDLFGFHNYFPAIWAGDYTNIFIDKLRQEIAKGKDIYIFSSGYDAENIISLLRLHGIWEVSSITGKSPVLHSDKAFIIFADYNWDLLNQIDPHNTLVGEKYIVFKALEHIQLSGFTSRHNKIKENFLKVIRASHFGELALFGAGSTASALLESLMLNIKYFLDNNVGKQKKEFRGIPVYAPEYYIKGDYVLIAVMDESAIYDQLIEMGVPDELIISGKHFLK